MIGLKPAISCALALAMLVGCSALQKKERRLPPLPLMPPAALGQPVQLTQSVTLETSTDSPQQTEQAISQPLSLLAVWSVNEDGLNFVGLTPAGQVLMTLTYDGEQFEESYSPLLSLNKSAAAMTIPGREILAQLQLTYWPISVIEQRLRDTPWRLTVNDHGRVLFLGQQQVLDIRFTATHSFGDSNEVIEITNTLMRHKLTIKTLTKAVLP